MGVSRFTIYRLIKSGRLPAKRFAGQWRFEQPDVDRLLTYKTPAKYIIKPDLMTLNEVCVYLGLSRFTIYRLLKSGKLPAVKSGGRWRFAKDEVRQFLTHGREVPAHVLGINFEGGVMGLSEASKILGVVRPTIYRLIKEGKLPATKIVGVWRLIKTEVARYMLDKKYRYGTTGVKGIFFWSQALDKYYQKKDIYYINDSAYDGFVGSRQDYHDSKTLKSIGAVMAGDKFFTELHYRKVPVRGGFVLTITYEQYDNLPPEEYVHWSGYRVSENQMKHLQL